MRSWSVPASGARSPPLAWPRRAGASACSSAARPTRRTRSRAAHSSSSTTSGTRARACTGCSTSGPSRASSAVCASGLGGGSLIYANVFLRKDERWFVKEDLATGGYESWPVTRRGTRPALRPGRGASSASKPSRSTTSPTRARRRRVPTATPPSALASTGRCRRWRSPSPTTGAPPVPGEPIAEPQPNLHGRTRETCRLCGECDVGCNYGAKNTLDYTYLSQAWRAGADLRTLCEVRGVRAARGRRLHGPLRPPRPRQRKAVRPTPARWRRRRSPASHLVLSAGTLGTTWLLLRNRAALPGLSGQLGRGFSGNGDLLTFALRCRERGADGERKPLVIDPARGPVITSAIRYPDELDGGDGPRLLPRGRRLPAVRELDAARLVDRARRRSLRATPRVIEYAWDAAARSPQDRERRARLRRCSATASCPRACCRCSGWAATSPTARCCSTNGQLEVDWTKHGASPPTSTASATNPGRSPTSSARDFVDNPIWLRSTA